MTGGDETPAATAAPGAGGSDRGLVTVRVLGVPMDVYLRSSEHGDELMREFAYIAAGAADPVAGTDDADEAGDAGLPVRLTTLVEELRARFAGFTVGPTSALAEAAARGDAAIDVEYVVPPSVVPGASELGELLDEADEFCRAGDLLTLASPPETVAFRRWFLGEFVRQGSGLPPTAWADWKP